MSRRLDTSGKPHYWRDFRFVHARAYTHAFTYQHTHSHKSTGSHARTLTRPRSMRVGLHCTADTHISVESIEGLCWGQGQAEKEGAEGRAAASLAPGVPLFGSGDVSAAFALSAASSSPAAAAAESSSSSSSSAATAAAAAAASTAQSRLLCSPNTAFSSTTTHVASLAMVEASTASTPGCTQGYALSPLTHAPSALRGDGGVGAPLPLPQSRLGRFTRTLADGCDFSQRFVQGRVALVREVVMHARCVQCGAVGKCKCNSERELELHARIRLDDASGTAWLNLSEGLVWELLAMGTKGLSRKERARVRDAALSFGALRFDQSTLKCEPVYGRKGEQQTLELGRARFTQACAGLNGALMCARVQQLFAVPGSARNESRTGTVYLGRTITAQTDLQPDLELSVEALWTPDVRIAASHAAVHLLRRAEERRRARVRASAGRRADEEQVRRRTDTIETDARSSRARMRAHKHTHVVGVSFV